jgi:hypothetical protein
MCDLGRVPVLICDQVQRTFKHSALIWVIVSVLDLQLIGLWDSNPDRFLLSVVWIRIGIRRTCMFLDLPDPDPSLFCKDPNADPSFINQKMLHKT